MQDFIYGSLSDRRSNVRGVRSRHRLILLVLLVACSSAPEPSPTPEPITGPFTFHADATGYWNGTTLLDVESSTSTISVSTPCAGSSSAVNQEAAVNELREILNSTDFLTLESLQSCPGGGYVTDAISYTLTLTYEGVTHTVKFYGGCYDVPSHMEALSKQVDELVRTYGGGYCCCCDYGGCWKKGE